uniref:Innexin n=1 Tax=Ditylenchus dipsaci TaxID=166011 RepID=A0A915DEH4_9BILA
MRPYMSSVIRQAKQLSVRYAFFPCLDHINVALSLHSRRSYENGSPLVVGAEGDAHTTQQKRQKHGLLSAISPLPDGDLVDRLNYSYTSTLLIVCSAFISGWSFVGQPIQCWFPAYYRGWWMEYALDYCYVSNTYFVHFTEKEMKNRLDITNGFLLFWPYKLYYFIYHIKANMEPEERGKNMEVVARFLIYDHDVTKSLGGRFKQALEGRIVLFTYIGVKLIYTLNALFQFFDLMAGKEWPETGNFPRVTLCDFAVRVLGNLHRHSVQCVLMINMFNEKIFLFLWFWFFAVAILSCINFFYWLFSSFNKSANQKLIISYLEKIDPNSSLSLNRREQAKKFINRTLRPDGLFLIRLISINSGDLITCQLIATLWCDYLAQNERPPSYAAAQDEPVPLLLGNNSDKKR